MRRESDRKFSIGPIQKLRFHYNDHAKITTLKPMIKSLVEAIKANANEANLS